MNVYSQLKVASWENVSGDPTLLPAGRFWLNTLTNLAKVRVNGVNHVVTLNDQAGTLTQKTINAPDNTITNIANVNISGTAAIAYSKLAALSASIVAVTDGSGVITSSGITTNELNYLSGLSDNVQNQFANLEGDLADVDTDLYNHKNNTSNPHLVTKLQVGLGNVDDVADINKPISTATQTALDLKANLASPTFTGTVGGITKSMVGLSNVDNTSDATKNSAVAVLTNKDIDGGTASNTSRITLPKAAKTTLDGLTRKAGTIVFSTDNNKPYYDDGSSLILVGSGSGAGGEKNFITGGDAETGTTGWATYADAAATRPVDGTGGTANVTWTSTATTPLENTNSFLFTKDAANRQGQGASFAFTVDAKDKAKVLKIEMDYNVVSGTFTAGTSTTDSDLIVYIYDVTNSRVIEPSSIKFLSNSITIVDKFQAVFQTASDSVSYRLIIHVASTSTAAFVLKFDDIKVNRSTYVFGTPITDWQNYTLNITATTTNPTKAGGSLINDNARWRRVGDSMEITYSYYQTAGGSAGTGTYLFSIPSGYTIDSTKIQVINDHNRTHVGSANAYSGSFGFGHIGHMYPSTTTTLSMATLADGQGASSPVSNSKLHLGGEVLYNFSARVPILGWSSSVQMSDSSDSRLVAFTGTGTGSTQAITANTTNIAFTSIKDSHGAWTGSTYVVSVPGDYKISGFFYSGATSFTASVYVNGTFQTYLAYCVSAFGGAGAVDIPNLKTGDIVSVRSSATLTFPADGGTRLSISRNSGPSAIAATEHIAARAFSGSARTYNTSSPTIVYEWEVYDTHGAYDAATGEFTAPISGLYEIKTSTITASVAPVVNHMFINMLKLNGTIQYYCGVYVCETANNVRRGFTGSCSIRLLAGQKISIGGYGDTTTTLSTDGGGNWVEFRRVGNY